MSDSFKQTAGKPIAPLFSAYGAARLEAVVRPEMLCVFDFDGTLAPIVEQPDQATLPMTVRDRLVTLQSMVPVAILTGRALTDIEARFDFKPDFMVGNHGLEGLPDSPRRRAGFAQQCSAWRQQLELAFADHARFDPTLFIEDKGISLSVHYRHVEDAAVMQAALVQLFAALTPAPRIIAGKCVFNLLPQGAGDKGTAFDELMRISGAKTAIYVGDDVTDEDVFRLSRTDLLSIRIGEHHDSAAELMVPEYADILLLLDMLIARLGGQSITRSSTQQPRP